MAEEHGGVRYTRIYADAAGESHFADDTIFTAPAHFAPPAPPLGVSPFAAAARHGFVVFPPGWYGDWHPTATQQWFFFLSGALEVTVSDGETRRFDIGSVVLTEDTTGRGHTTRNLAPGETVAAVVQVPI